MVGHTICEEDSKPTASVNIAGKLRAREVSAWPCAAQAAGARHFYENLLPNVSIQNVELPDCFINRFTGSGEYLVCFGNMQHDLVLYRFTGSDQGYDLEQQAGINDDPPAFSRFFTLLYQRTLAHGTELLCRDFSLTVHQETFLLLSSSCLPGLTDETEDPNAARIQGLVNVPGTTFHLLELATGQVLDEYSIPNDFIHLANNSGANLYDDLLAICAVNSQSIHLVHVHPAGKLIPLHIIGKHCFPDDGLVLARAQETEDVWRQKHRNQARQIDRSLSQLQSEAERHGRTLSPAPAPAPAIPQHAAGPSAPPAVQSGRLEPGQEHSSLVSSPTQPQPPPGPHAPGSLAALNQDRAFLASHYVQGSHQAGLTPDMEPTQPPAPPPPGNLRDAGALLRAPSSNLIRASSAGLGRSRSASLMPVHPGAVDSLPVNLQRAASGLAHASQQDTPALAGMPGPPEHGDASHAALAGDQGLGRGRVEEDEEADQEQAGVDAAAPQIPATEGELEAAIDALDADAGLQGALLPAAVARSRGRLGGEGAGAGWEQSVLLQGIQHRFLVSFFRDAWPHGPSSEAIFKFHGMFDYINSLVIWKVQLLDRDHLLLALGSPHASASRLAHSHHHRSWLAVYAISSASILTLKDTLSRSLLQTCVSHLGDLHNGCPATAWERYVSSPMTDLTTRRHVLAQLSRSSGAQHQSIRRMLATIPVSSQMLCGSPYLDTRLFMYDDKLIGPMIKPRPFTSQPVKILSRMHPESSKFRLGPSTPEVATQASRTSKNSIFYLFHPVQPFVMCITAVNAQQTRLDICMRE